jgi:hypothetical protein
VSGTNGGVRNGDRLGSLRFQGTDSAGATGNNGAGFWAVATEDWSSTGRGSYLDVLTTNNGATSFSTKMRIHNDGGVELGAFSGSPGAGSFSLSGDVLLATGKAVKVAGNQVLTNRQTAIADVTTANATDLTTAIALANANKAKINTILAMLRTHGLIAT